MEAHTQPPVVADKGRDLHVTKVTLERWLASQLGVAAVEVANLTYPTGAGISNETILFDAEWTDGPTPVHRPLVLRVAPSGFQLFPDTAFRQQFDLLRTLHEHRLVRVAEVLWFEDDTDLLGGPFFVMSRLSGRVPVSMPVYNQQGWLFDATPADRRRLWENAMAELARIHLAPVDLFPFLDRPHRGATGLEQDLNYWCNTMSWSTGGTPPDVLLEAHDWLVANLPDDRPNGLAWGDARIGNMMFGEDFDVVGVMDWEQASLGGGRKDLAWWLYLDDFYSVDHGLVRLDGLGNRTETIELWEDLTGAKAGDLRWYEAFAGFQLVQLGYRVRLLMGGQPGGGPSRGNPFLPRLVRLLDLSSPTT